MKQARHLGHYACALVALTSAVTACRAMGPGDLVSGITPPPDQGQTVAGLATADGGVAPPSGCAVSASDVTKGTQVQVAAGAFAMGCNATADTQCQPDEKPQHMVTLDAFAVDVTEVTQAQYDLCVQAGACTLPYCPWNPCTSPNLPIACVDRAQAIAYCTYVGESLPTEAQWEKAARGTDGRVYPWGDTAPDCNLANLDGCRNGTMNVGSLPDGASAYGALDMAGNVVEWTLDAYDATYYASSPSTNPTGPATTSDTSFVGRGGGWRSAGVWQRTSARDIYDGLYVKDSMGFRCVINGSST